MLLESVLTETVRDEKLYVSFTVEGYFHFVLGEVIYQQTSGKKPKALQDLLEHNQLNGIRDGIEQCLIRDVQKNDFSRLMWLINNGVDKKEICAIPLANSFFNIRIKINCNEEYLKAIKEQILVVFNEFNSELTVNQIHAFEFAISYLVDLQKYEVISVLYKIINDKIIPNNFHSASLYLRSLDNSLPKSELILKIKFLEDLNIENDKSARFALFLRRLGQLYYSKNIANFERAIIYFKQALEIDMERYPKSYIEVSVNYGMIGLAYMANGDFENAILNYQASLSVLSENNHHDLTTALEPLGILELKRKNYVIALDYFDKTLKAKINIFGNYHSEVSSTTSAVKYIQEKLNQLNDL
jgi:tetratricopeptide (TPR) repeat protein